MHKRSTVVALGLILGLCLAACASRLGGERQVPADTAQETAGVNANLPNLGPAPELDSSTWLNTDQPLKLADLRGRVVLIDMWTFG